MYVFVQKNIKIKGLNKWLLRTEKGSKNSEKVK